MERLKRIIFCICMVIFSCLAYAQNDFCTARNTSFKEGEKLTFKVFYNMSFIWIHAGNATFTTVLEDLNGHKVYHITGDGKTASSYEWFYKVKDKYQTYIDVASMAPDRFIRDVHEGSTKFTQDVWFSHQKGTAISRNKAYSITKCTQDVLSAIYFARNIDYNKYNTGDRIPFNMFLDDKLYSLYLSQQRRHFQIL